MAVKFKFHHGEEPKNIAYRKRLWVFNELIQQNYQMPREKMSSAKSMDIFLFEESNKIVPKGLAEDLMQKFNRSFWDGVYGRESAGENILSWVSESDRRFLSWAFIYWNKILRHDSPLIDSEYIEKKDKLVLWFDCLQGNRNHKAAVEATLKKAWQDNIGINRILPVLSRQDDGVMSAFWSGTLSRFEKLDQYHWAKEYDIGFDTPVSEEECYYSSLLLFDLSALSLDAKKEIIRGIKKRWSNNKRQKVQVNVSLSPSAAKELAKIADRERCGKSELIESWIMREKS